MVLRTPQRQTIFGALDSDRLASGEPSDAHVLRTLGMGANRLATRAQPLSQLVWTYGDDDPSGYVKGPGSLTTVAPPFWFQITPTIQIRKKPLITVGLLMWGIAAAGAVLVRAATQAKPLDPKISGSDENTIAFAVLTADPSSAAGRLATIPLRPGPEESVTYYIRGIPGAEGNGGTFGNPSSGTVDEISGDGRVITVQSGAFNATTRPTPDGTSYAESGHCIAFLNGVGSDPILPRWIRRVIDSDRLLVFPPLEDTYRGDAMNGADYIIKKIPLARFQHLSLYGREVDL